MCKCADEGMQCSRMIGMLTLSPPYKLYNLITAKLETQKWEFEPGLLTPLGVK